MFSVTKVLANRRNAQLSTGPRTAGGKLVASRNAVRHGVWAAAPVIPGEDPAAWDAHRAGILASLVPAGVLEQTLAERTALVLWRLNRLARYEALTTAADIEDAVLPQPAGETKLNAILCGRGDELDKSITEVRKQLAAARRRLKRVRPAAAVLPTLPTVADADPVPARIADTLLAVGYDHVTQYPGTEPPAPGARLLKKLGRVEKEVEDVPWTAGLVRQALGFYAGSVAGGSADWLAGKVAAELEKEGRTLDRREKRLRQRLAGLAERWRNAAMWRAADVVMPVAGRDERIIRYESHLHKLLTSTLHELERLQATRAGRDVPLPLPVDVAMVVTGGD